MKSWVRYTLATTLFVVGVGGSIAYNQFVAPMLTSEWVYVARTQMPADTPIQAADVERIRVPKSEVSPDAITNAEGLIGAYTAQPVDQNQVLTALDTEPDPFTITPGTEDVPIPSTWIASVSETLRQGDYVDLIPIAQPQAGANNVGTLTTTSEASEFKHLLVLSVHTDNNAEVTSQQTAAPQSVGARGNGSGVPASVDVKMTTAEAQALASLIQEKYQLLIVGVSDETRSGGGAK